MLLQNAQTQHKAIQDRQIAGRRRYLVNLEVTSKSQADRLITDPDEPLPTDLACREQQVLKDRTERLEKQRERDEQEKVKKSILLSVAVRNRKRNGREQYAFRERH